MEQTHSDSNKNSPAWFESWFDTQYYHLLYKDRNDTEAQRFIDVLTYHLNLSPESKLLDLACGKGRHSIYLNSLGYDVTGVDLSEQSIQFANQFANPTLRFEVQDMRNPLNHQYDAVLNLFTSFGYFEEASDDAKVLLNMKNAISEFGLGVIDFLNVPQVLENMIPTETKTLEGITFNIQRYVKDGFICKQIDFTDNGKNYSFSEKVRAYTLADFQHLMESLDIHLLEVFGNYQLGKYSPTSERLILIFK